MKENMDLAGKCTEGVIEIRDFIPFSMQRAMRTHVLDKGDYVFIPNPLNRFELRIEQITDLHFLEQGDFRTAKGTTGPISGNVFIKIKEDGRYILVEGDNVRLGNGSAYDTVLQYLKHIDEGQRGAA